MAGCPFTMTTDHSNVQTLLQGKDMEPEDMGARVVMGEDASLVISGCGSTPSGGHGAATNGHDTKVMNPMITPNLEHLNNSNAPNL